MHDLSQGTEFEWESIHQKVSRADLQRALEVVSRYPDSNFSCLECALLKQSVVSGCQWALYHLRPASITTFSGPGSREGKLEKAIPNPCPRNIRRGGRGLYAIIPHCIATAPIYVVLCLMIGSTFGNSHHHSNNGGFNCPARLHNHASIV